jgi:hypothetical protein
MTVDSRNSVGGMAARSQGGRNGVRIPAGPRHYFLLHNIQPGSGPTEPPVKWVPGFFPSMLKRPGREVDHSPPSSAEVKNEWSYVSHICLRDVDRDSCTSTLMM